MPRGDNAGRPAHKPTDEQRRAVEAMSAVGIPQDDIALVIGIDRNTLAKHYRKELDQAATKANAKVGQTLYQKAINGDTAAAIWWSKARMKWSEKQEIEHAGKDGAPLTLWGTNAAKE